jgi:integrase/recombinase XerD
VRDIDVRGAGFTSLTQKEQAIARVTPPDAKPGRYRAPDTLIAFLEAL